MPWVARKGTFQSAFAPLHIKRRRVPSEAAVVQDLGRLCFLLVCARYARVSAKAPTDGEGR